MFWRLRNSVGAFMQGRYGNDRLNRFLLAVYFVIWIVSWFVRGVAGLVLYALTLSLVVVVFFRMLSRNIVARQVENEKYLRWMSKVAPFFKRQMTRVKDISRWRYRRCPGCSAYLRLPIRRGKRTVTCSRCHTQFGAFFL